MQNAASPPPPYHDASGEGPGLFQWLNEVSRSCSGGGGGGKTKEIAMKNIGGGGVKLDNLNKKSPKGVQEENWKIYETKSAKSNLLGGEAGK